VKDEKTKKIGSQKDHDPGFYPTVGQEWTTTGQRWFTGTATNRIRTHFLHPYQSW
jgi:hypothetical protein